MSKRYSDELAAWVKKRAEGKRRVDAAAVAFLAVKSDVSEALDAGYAMKTIWEHMHETGRIQTGYEAFRKHVKRHIKDAKTPPTPAADQSKTADPSPRTKAKPSAIGGFQYNQKPNKEELL